MTDETPEDLERTRRLGLPFEETRPISADDEPEVEEPPPYRPPPPREPTDYDLDIDEPEPEPELEVEPIEKIVFTPQRTEPPEPAPHRADVAPVRVRVEDRPVARVEPKAFRRRRYLTLAAFAQALIPPGGAIEQSADDAGVAERIDAAAVTFDPAVRKRISRLLFLWEWSSVFTRAVRPFSRLPLPVAVGVVERGSRSTLALRKQAFSFLKTLCLNEWASTTTVEQAVGFTYSCVTNTPLMETQPLEVLGFGDVTRDHVEDCDVVVVGSGAGGAVIAKELAEVGLSVVVLEEGSLFTRKDFAGPPWERFRRLYRAQGTTVAAGRPAIPMPLGKAVGGTTLVNSGSCFRTPDRVLRAWQSEHGIDGIDPETMRPFFERVERILHVRAVPEDLLGSNGRLFRRGADSLGLHGAPTQRNINAACRGCGTCVFGCPSDGMQTAHLSYLPRAQRHGAGILANARAERIFVEGGRARGVQARLVNPDTGAPGPVLTVRSKVVVLAAGAVHTPVLLQRNALGGRSGQLGHNLRIHPAATVAASFDDDVYSWRGTMQPYFVDEWQESHDLLVEAASLTPGVSAGALPGTGAAVKELVAHMKHLAGANVYVADTSSGRVRAVGSGEPLVSYTLNKTDTRKLVRGIAHVAEVFLAAGARTVYTGLPGAPTVSSKLELDDVKETAVRPAALRLSAFHPTGTVRMGADPSLAVLDPWGEAHDVAGLFVTDASMLPGTPAVAPMVTIMALATRTADHIVRERERYFA